MIVCQQDKAMSFLPLVTYAGLLAPPPPWLSPSSATTASAPLPQVLMPLGTSLLVLAPWKGKMRRTD